MPTIGSMTVNQSSVFIFKSATIRLLADGRETDTRNIVRHQQVTNELRTDQSDAPTLDRKELMASGSSRINSKYIDSVVANLFWTSVLLCSDLLLYSCQLRTKGRLILCTYEGLMSIEAKWIRQDL